MLDVRDMAAHQVLAFRGAGGGGWGCRCLRLSFLISAAESRVPGSAKAVSAHTLCSDGKIIKQADAVE